MKRRIFAGAILAIVLVAGNMMAAGTLESGPQEGDKLIPFAP